MAFRCKTIRTCLAAFISLLLLSATMMATTYLVSLTSEDKSIQRAIDMAGDGDRVIVGSGTYLERLNVTKKLIIRGVDTGGGIPIVNANEKGTAITLSADGTWLEGFFIKDSGSYPEDAGIKVFSNNNLIRRNILNNNSYGIYLKNSAGNRIEYNTAIKNDVGIALQSSRNNILKCNTAKNNSFAGFFSGNSRDDKVINNTIENNKWVGFLFNATENETIQGNLAIRNANAGIWILYSRSNRIEKNNASNNPIYGILLDASFNNTLTENTAYKNLDGISMHISCSNIIAKNNIINNMFGIYLDESSKNLIYFNNFIENILSVYSFSSTNQWNSNKAFSYFYKDLMSLERMGNFWSDYEGKAAYESGIGSTAYVNEFIRDEKPLLSRTEYYQILE